MDLYLRCRTCEGTGKGLDGECEECDGYGGFWVVQGPTGGVDIRLVPGDRDHRPGEEA